MRLAVIGSGEDAEADEGDHIGLCDGELQLGACLYIGIRLGGRGPDPVCPGIGGCGNKAPQGAAVVCIVGVLKGGITGGGGSRVGYRASIIGLGRIPGDGDAGSEAVHSEESSACIGCGAEALFGVGDLAAVPVAVHIQGEGWRGVTAPCGSGDVDITPAGVPLPLVGEGPPIRGGGCGAEGCSLSDGSGLGFRSCSDGRGIGVAGEGPGIGGPSCHQDFEGMAPYPQGGEAVFITAQGDGGGGLDQGSVQVDVRSAAHKAPRCVIEGDGSFLGVPVPIQGDGGPGGCLGVGPCCGEEACGDVFVLEVPLIYIVVLIGASCGSAEARVEGLSGEGSPYIPGLGLVGPVSPGGAGSCGDGEVPGASVILNPDVDGAAVEFREEDIGLGGMVGASILHDGEVVACRVSHISILVGIELHDIGVGNAIIAQAPSEGADLNGVAFIYHKGHPICWNCRALVHLELEVGAEASGDLDLVPAHSDSRLPPRISGEPEDPVSCDSCGTFYPDQGAG